VFIFEPLTNGVSLFAGSGFGRPVLRKQPLLQENAGSGSTSTRESVPRVPPEDLLI